MESGDLRIAAKATRLKIERLQLAIDCDESRREDLRGPSRDTRHGAEGRSLGHCDPVFTLVDRFPGRGGVFDCPQGRHHESLVVIAAPRTAVVADVPAADAPAFDAVTADALEVATGLVSVGAD
jgi:hypothetical protein